MRAEQQYARTREANYRRGADINFVPITAQADISTVKPGKEDATFGQRLASRKTMTKAQTSSNVKYSTDGGLEMCFIPSSATEAGPAPSKKNEVKKGVEVLGASMERSRDEPREEIAESERRGRTHRRKGQRSGSRNTFRAIAGS